MYYDSNKNLSKTEYKKAMDKALNNGEVFHLAAFLRRKRRIIRIGTNSHKTHPAFRRRYKNGEDGYTMHAEMDVLRFAEPGDTIEVIRWNAKGVPTMSRPCEHCMRAIRKAGIKKIMYTDWNGNHITQKVLNE